MKLTNAYIIDGDVIEKRIAELEEFKKIMIDAVERKELDVLKKIMHQAKPALPIMEKYMKPTIDYTLRYGSQNSVEWILNELKQDFLTKDF